MLSPMAGHPIRSMVHLECGAILRALASTRRIHESVHEARKAIRRLRALLALIADAEWEDVDRIDRELQRLGDALSTLRDAHVAVGSAARLARRDARWAPLVDRLIAQRDAQLQQALDDDPGFQRKRDIVSRVDGRLDALPWESLQADVLRDGLERSRHRVEKAKKKAQADPTLDKLHRWRRRARRLRMQLNAFGDAGGSEAKGLHKVGDRLGALQDLRMLRKRIKRMPDLPHRDELLLYLFSEIKANAVPRHVSGWSR